MPEENENGIPKLPEGTGIIPHFYYDVMGRIVPGAYLLIGAYWLAVRHGSFLKLDVPLSATTLLWLLVAAYAVSFIIGPVSHLLFNWLRQFKEADIPAYTRDAFARDDFTHLKVEEKSELCFYTLWLRAPRLAVITSRWDAEAFAARQFGTATLVLSIVLGYMIFKGPRPDHPKVLAIFAVSILALCAFQFRYSRKKAILSRFIMFARTSAEKARGKSA